MPRLLRNLRLAVPLLLPNNPQGADPDAEYLASMLAFTPIAGYDPSISNVWQDTGGATPAADDADVVGRVDDVSGNGYHVTQGTTGSKMSLRLDIQNGFPALRGDGLDDFLRNSAFADFSDVYTAFLVANLHADGDTAQGLLEVSNGTANTGFNMYMLTTLSANLRDASSTRIISHGTDARDGATRIHRLINTGTQGRYRLNGGADATVSYTAPNPNTLNQLDIGQILASTSYRVKGDIVSLWLFGEDKTADAAAIETLLNDRYEVY